MTSNVNGTAVVLYTFTQAGDNAEKYQKKVDDLKQLLPKKIVDLEDQSSILIQTECNIKELENKLENKYNGSLQKSESVTLISIQGGSMKCMCILPTSIEDEVMKEINSHEPTKDIDRQVKLAKLIVQKLRENTKHVLEDICTK